MSCEAIGYKKREQIALLPFSVPGPGLEPGWVAPTVFETVASTDSAIRALRCKVRHFLWIDKK